MWVLLVGIFGGEDVAQLGDPNASALTRLPRMGCGDLGTDLGNLGDRCPNPHLAPPRHHPEPP